MKNYSKMTFKDFNVIWFYVSTVTTQTTDLLILINLKMLHTETNGNKENFKNVFF